MVVSENGLDFVCPFMLFRFFQSDGNKQFGMAVESL